MTQSITLLSLPVLATAELSPERFITAAGTYAAPGGNALGTTRTQTLVDELTPVAVIGTAVVTAAGPLAIDDRIQVGADGKATVLAGGTAVAVALQAASADGDRIEVLLLPN